MKRIKQVFLVLILFLSATMIFPPAKALNQIDVYFFHNRYCLNCQSMDDYLTTLDGEYDNLVFHYYEIGDADNLALLKEVADTFGVKAEVPLVVIGGLAFPGFNPQIEADIRQTVIRYSTSDFVDIVAKIQHGDTVLVSDFDTLERTTLHLPLIGEVPIASLSLTTAAVVLGFVDGFNPCAMWVLIFLISMLINSQNRKRMWLIGFTFLFASGLMYFLIMVSWLQIAVSITTVSWIRILIGAFALGFGGYHVVQFIRKRNEDVGCEVTDDKQRKRFMEKIKAIVKKQNLFLALVGVTILAVSVNLVELACSAGLPLLFTQILAYNDLSTGVYFGYIGIYIFFFLIDDIVIFTIAMLTMKVTGISNRYTKYSSLVGGLIMLAIGILMIFFPNILMFNF